jgi:hypothetical protein
LTQWLAVLNTASFAGRKKWRKPMNAKPSKAPRQNGSTDNFLRQNRGVFKQQIVALEQRFAAS